MNQTNTSAHRITPEKTKKSTSAFSGSKGLRNSIITSVGVVVASFFLSINPAHAQSAKCTARVVSGDRGEPHSLKVRGAKVESLTLRFLMPRKGTHLEVRFPGPFVQGLLSRPEDEMAMILGSNHAKARESLGYRKVVSFTCIAPTGKSAPVATAPAVPQVDVGKLIKTARARGKELATLSRQTGVKLQTAREAKALIGKRGELTRAVRSRDAAKLQAAIRSADESIKTMRTEQESSRDAMKREALDLQSQLREHAMKLPPGRQKISALQLADSLETEAKRGTMRMKSLSGKMGKVQSAISKVRGSLEASERHAEAEKQRAAAAKQKAAEDRAKAAASKGGMDKCTGFPYAIESGRGDIKGYPIEVPLRIRVQAKGQGREGGKMYELRIPLRLTALDLTSGRIKGTVDRATKTLGAKILKRCPAADDKALGQVSAGVRATVVNARNKTIEHLDRLIEDGETEELGTLMKVRALIAGESRAQEEARKQKARDRAKRRGKLQ